MKFSVSETIRAPRHQVEAALVDPAYYASLATGTSSMRPPELLDAALVDTTIETHVRYAFQGQLSGPASMVVDSDKLTWVIAIRLETTTHVGTLRVLPDHYEGMLTCEATVALDEVDGSTVETISCVLEVKVPLVCGAAEKAILGGFT